MNPQRRPGRGCTLRTSTTTISISGAGRFGGFSSNRNAAGLSPSSPRPVTLLGRGLSVCASSCGGPSMISGSSTSGGQPRHPQDPQRVQHPDARCHRHRRARTEAFARYAREGALCQDRGGDAGGQARPIGGHRRFGGIVWRDCPPDWHKPFLPAGKGDFFHWPMLLRLVPLAAILGPRSKVLGQFRRLPKSYNARWEQIISETNAKEQTILSKATRDRNESTQVSGILDFRTPFATYRSLKSTETIPEAYLAGTPSVPLTNQYVNSRTIGVGDYVQTPPCGTLSLSRMLSLLTALTEAIRWAMVPAWLACAYLPDSTHISEAPTVARM